MTYNYLSTVQCQEFCTEANKFLITEIAFRNRFKIILLRFLMFITAAVALLLDDGNGLV